jgi:hypothetical protein
MTAEQCRAKSVSLPRVSSLFRPHIQPGLVETPGTAPGSTTVIPRTVYRRSSLRNTACMGWFQEEIKRFLIAGFVACHEMAHLFTISNWGLPLMPKIAVTVHAYKFATFERAKAKPGQPTEACYASMKAVTSDGRKVNAVAWDDSARQLDRSLAVLTPQGMDLGEMGFTLELTGEERLQERKAGGRSWQEKTFHIDRNDGFAVLTGPAQEMHRARMSAGAAHAAAALMADAGDHEGAYRSLQAFVARFARLPDADIPEPAPEEDVVQPDAAQTASAPGEAIAETMEQETVPASAEPRADVVENPVVETPVVEAAVVEAPVVEAPVVEAAVVEEASSSSVPDDTTLQTESVQAPIASSADEIAVKPATVEDLSAAFVTEASVSVAAVETAAPVSAPGQEQIIHEPAQVVAPVSVTAASTAAIPPSAGTPRRRSLMGLSVRDSEDAKPVYDLSSEGDETSVQASGSEARLPTESPEAMAARDMGVTPTRTPIPPAPSSAARVSTPLRPPGVPLLKPGMPQPAAPAFRKPVPTGSRPDARPQASPARMTPMRGLTPPGLVPPGVRR